MNENQTQTYSLIKKIKLIIYDVISAKKGKWYSFIYDVLISVIAVFSVIPLITEKSSPFIDELTNLHWYFISIFVFDYIIKWFIADVTYGEGKKSYLYYPFSSWAVIDFIAIVPAIIGLEIMQAFIALRLLRLTRIFPNIESGFRFIFRSIFTYWRVLFVIFITFTTIIFIGGIFIYVVEYGINPSIDSYWDSVWFVFVTITTIGYGDITPYTTWGRVFSSFFYFIGLGYLALVTATVVAGFQKQIKKFRKSIEQDSISKNVWYKKLFGDKKAEKENQKSLINSEPYYNLKEKFDLSSDYVILNKDIDKYENLLFVFENDIKIEKEKNDSNR